MSSSASKSLRLSLSLPGFSSFWSLSSSDEFPFFRFFATALLLGVGAQSSSRSARRVNRGPGWLDWRHFEIRPAHALLPAGLLRAYPWLGWRFLVRPGPGRAHDHHLSGR